MNANRLIDAYRSQVPTLPQKLGDRGDIFLDDYTSEK